jgi:hypothetical protein
MTTADPPAARFNCYSIMHSEHCSTSALNRVLLWHKLVFVCVVAVVDLCGWVLHAKQSSLDHPLKIHGMASVNLHLVLY